MFSSVVARHRALLLSGSAAAAALSVTSPAAALAAIPGVPVDEAQVRPLTGALPAASGQSGDRLSLAGGAVGAASGPMIFDENARIVRAVSARPVRLTSGAATADSSARMEDADRLSADDDHIINTGTLVLNVSRDFGAGNDRFTNKGGVVRFDTSDTPLTLAFTGLEQFVNEGGLIDLRNGRAGDSLSLSGAYSASGDARLALDVNGGAADSLVVTGRASGRTQVNLAALKPEQATLFASPIKLISVGAGSAANTFTLVAPDQGLVRYRLTYDAKGSAYMLDAGAGRPVLQSVRAVEGLRFAWRSSAEALDTEQAMVRAAGGEGGRVWAVAHGASISRDSGDAGRELEYAQDLAGGQMGVSLGAPKLAGGDTAFGLTGGYVDSTLSFEGSGQSITMKTFNLGLYGAWRLDNLYATALVKADHHSLVVEDDAAGFTSDVDGLSWGVRLEAGHRINLGHVAFDPIVGLDYLSTRIDDLIVLGQQVVLDDRQGFSGRLGGRVLTRHAIADGRHMELSGGLELVHDFDAAQKGALVSHNQVDTVELTGPETYGRALAGVQIGLSQHLQAYFQAEGRFGDGQNGGGLRIGARYRF